MKKVILLLGFMAAVLMLSHVLAAEQKMGLEVDWTYNTSAQFPDKSFGAGHQGGPAIFDIDNDGMMEILWGTRRGDSKRLWCINGDGSFQWIYPPIGEDGLPGDPTSKVSFVDVNNDGIYEICLAGRGGRLHVLKPDGSVLWTWDEPNAQNMHGGPQALDTDGDGNVEFFMCTNDGFVHRVDHEGNHVWTSFQAGAGNQGHPCIADVDRDGVGYEVVFASQDQHVYAIDAATGQEKWRFNTGANQQTNPVFVADVNNDGEYEVVTWTDQPSSAVFVIAFWGSELGRWTHPREGINLRIGQAFGDVDNDGNLEMACMSGDAVFLIDMATLTTEWEINFTQWSAEGKLPAGALADHWSSYQLIADIDGDGAQEILWLSPFPIVTDAATGALEGYYVDDNIAVNRRQESSAAWGDPDGDGKSEWVCELNGNSHPETLIYSLTMNGAFPAESTWPEYIHSALPGPMQIEADWLTLKGAYSNSYWIPVPEVLLPSLAGLLLLGLLRRRR